MPIVEMKKNANQIHETQLKTALWGVGTVFSKYASVIIMYESVVMIVDESPDKVGMKIDSFICQPPTQMDDVEAVIIMMDDVDQTKNILRNCDKRGFIACSYKDILNIILPLYEDTIIKQPLIDVKPEDYNKMTKYIGLNVPSYGCNLDCDYCYLNSKRTGKDAFPKFIHSPRYIRSKLSREIIGGSALIGICSDGETLFADRLEEICYELLKEGHYIIIVTNGLYTQKIKDILEMIGEYASHLLFKVSLHYLELKRNKLLKKFSDNMQLINDSMASYTLELMPNDDLVPLIGEVMKYSKKEFGALPQLTVGRDEKNERKILSSYSNEEYYNIWKVFNSEMFELKIKYYMLHGKNCDAGKKSFFINLETGAVYKCLFDECAGNFYEDDFKLNLTRVGDDCPLSYCYNCHAYVTIGVLPDYSAPTLTKIRDRVRDDGSHWLKQDIYKYLDIKI